MFKQIDVSTISQIVAGKKATINLDVGWKYLVVHVKRTNFTAAQATAVQVKANGKPFQQFNSLQDVEDINTHFNRPQIAGITSFFFARPELADSEDREITGIGTADLKTLQIEFVIDAAAVNPDVEVKAEVDNNEPMGYITQIETSDIDLAKVGKNVVSKMPIGNGNVFAYFLKKPTDDFTDIKLDRIAGGVRETLIDSTQEFLEVAQKQAAEKPRVPPTGMTAIDFVLSGVPEDAMQADSILLPGDTEETVVDRISADLTVATAEVVTVITDSVGPFQV